MPMHHVRLLLAGLALFLPAEASAWWCPGPYGPAWCAPCRCAPWRTGTGGGPWSTITAPHTSFVGRTKPPGRGVGPTPPFVRRQLRSIEARNDRIAASICVGCERR